MDSASPHQPWAWVGAGKDERKRREAAVAARVRVPVGRRDWLELLDDMVCVYSVVCVEWWWMVYGVIGE